MNSHPEWNEQKTYKFPFIFIIPCIPNISRAKINISSKAMILAKALTVATLLSDDSKKRSNDHTDCSLTMIVHKSTVIANFISNDISTRVESSLLYSKHEMIRVN